MLSITQSKRTHFGLVAIILILSAYVHLWNPAGFPDIFFDEGIYMRRAVNVLESGNPQEGVFYDHPYFGQLVLAGFLKLAGFPDSVQASLEASYLVPRVLMGVFAVLDTLLIYGITQKKFGKKIAVLSGILFAVMPITWLFRRILLDTILMPLLLSSILFALHSRDSQRRGMLVLFSGIFLGLAIFTKITAVTMVPLVAYLIFLNPGRIRHLVRWFAPVLLIPLAWPGVSVYLGQFDLWLNDVLWQAGRNTGDFLVVLGYLFNIDAVIMGLGLGSFVFAAIRRNVFLILWFSPFLLFVANIGFLQYFHYILIIPVICISTAFMLHWITDRITGPKIRSYTFAITCVAVAVFGTSVSGVMINTDASSSQFETLRFLLANFDDSDTTILAGPAYSWILDDVYGKNNVPTDYSLILFEPVNTEKVILVADSHYVSDINRDEIFQRTYDRLNNTYEIYGETSRNTVFPFEGTKFTDGGIIEIKRNWDGEWNTAP